MLLERAEALANNIQAFRKLEAAAREENLVTTRVRQVREAAQLLGNAKQTLTQFAQAGVPVQFAPVNSADLKQKATLLRTMAADSPAALANPPFNVTHDFSDRLKGIAAAAHLAVQSGWRTFVAGRSLNGSEEVLTALNQVPQLRIEVTKIRLCRQQANALATSIPKDPASAIDRLGSLEAEHNAAWAALTSDGIPADVLVFLRRCASEGAPLASLTEEVRDWLGSKQLLSSFRIRIG